MFKGLHHVGYQTDDLDAAIAYVEQTFGGHVKQRATAGDGKTKLAYVGVGDVEWELIEPGDKSALGGRTGLILHHVGWRVDDADATMKQLGGHGVKFQTPYTSAQGVKIAYMEAPTVRGTNMHLSQFPK